MKKLVSLLLTAAISLSALPIAFAEPDPSIAITEKPDYRGHILSQYEFMLNRKNSHSWDCNTAMRYYRATGEQRYLDDAIKYFTENCNEMANDPKKLANYGNDFFSGNYVMETYWELKKLGKVTDAQTEIITQYMDKFFNENLLESHNQIIARAVGTAYAVQALPDAPNRDKWIRWLDKLWNYWYEDRDMQEDAGDYNAIMMRDIIRWAEVDGRLEQLKDEGIRKMFERYRDQVANNGSMPEYGDDFYGRSMDWIYVFEWCANFYDDPTFAYAARHMYDWALKNGLIECILDTEILDIPDLYDTAYLNERGAHIATKNYKGDKNVSEKVFIRASKKDGSPFIMLDNGRYRISHSHPAAKGAVVYYEYDNIPLYHSLTRRFIDPRYQNIPLIMDDAGYYPFDTVPGSRFNPGRGRTGVWYHDSIELSGLAECDDNDTSKREIDEIIYRFNKEKTPSLMVYIDNIRLEGPAGVKMIYDFEDGKIGNFNRSDSPYENVEGGYESNRALKVTVDDNGVFYSSKEEIRFSLNDYTHLKWDWKTATPEGDATTGLWFIFRLMDYDCDVTKAPRAANADNGNCYIETQPGSLYNDNSYMTDDMVENKGGDSYTSFKLNSHLTPNSTVERRIVLTEEGYAVIQDTVTAGEEADGFFGGPIFNLYNVKESGRNWFRQKGEKKWYKNSKDTEGATNGMFVYYAEHPASEISYIKSTEGAVTTYLKTTLKKNTPTTFITVLAPNLDDEKSGKDIAKNIVVTRDNTRDSVVNIKSDNGWITVNMPSDNSWSVVHRQKNFAGIKAKLNGSYMSFNQPPENVNGRILVPFRSVFEGLGATISFNAAENSVTGEREGRSVKVILNDTTAYIDGKPVTLDVPAQNINGSTMVPIRFISESFDSTVTWNNDIQLVEIFAQIPESALKDDTPKNQQPLLSNGDMEFGVAGWAAKNSKISFDKEVKRNGTTSMKISTDPASEKSWRGAQHDDIEVEEGCTYKITAWFKTENLKSDSKPRITFGVKNGAGEWVVRDSDNSIKNLLIHTGGNVSDWTEMTTTYTIPEGGSLISYFTPRLDTSKDTSGEQTVWFDDISIELVE